MQYQQMLLGGHPRQVLYMQNYQHVSHSNHIQNYCNLDCLRIYIFLLSANFKYFFFIKKLLLFLICFLKQQCFYAFGNGTRIISPPALFFNWKHWISPFFFLKKKKNKVSLKLVCKKLL